MKWINVVVVLFSLIASAQHEDVFRSASLVTTFNKEVIEYQYNSLDDLQKGIDDVVYGIDYPETTNRKEVCEVIIEIKIEITIGEESIVLSEKMKSGCVKENIDSITKRLKAILVAATG